MDSQKFLGRSVAVSELVDEAGCVARSDARILISGEHGVGKTLLARIIHEQSGRSRLPIVPVSCILPEALLESELFGPSTGQDARDEAHGMLALANGGTVVLDEAGEMSPRIQRLLLRYLDSGDMRRDGSAGRPVLPARIVSTSSCDLFERTQRKEFSDELFYRLNIVHLVIPSLRERREDVPLLWDHFVNLASAHHNLLPPEMAIDAVGALQTYEWPGNLREMKTVADRIVLRYSGRAISAPHVSAQLAAPRVEPSAAPPSPLRIGATAVDHLVPGRAPLWTGLRGRASRR